MALFLNLPEIAVNKNIISKENEQGKWTSIPYETKLGKGNLLITPEGVNPENIMLDINLEGWHRIYCCMINIGNDTYTHIKLTDDLCFTGMRTPPQGNPTPWMQYEYMQEFYWKSADLTGQQIILKKPDTYRKQTSNLVWIRCEKMGDEEIKNYNSEPVRCIHGHIDTDQYSEEKFENIDETLIKLHALKNSNIDFCQIETFIYRDQLKYDTHLPFQEHIPPEWQGNKFDAAKLYKRQIEYGHEIGLKIYAGLRMSAGNFISPPCPKFFNKNFFAENKHLYCKNRDGRTINVCSYAYPETQEYMIEHILNDMSYGFDGVSLIFIRGIHIGFEQPVLDRFEELYPGINPKILPITDKRLHGVWCEFMTEFMRNLRNRLEPHIKINVLTDYGLATSKHLGLDVEAWASQGLIDSASQSDMETYEDLDGCLADDGTIDMDKYIRKSQDTEIIRRNYGTRPDIAFSHIKEYQELEKYGIDVYNIMPWVHCSLTVFNDYVEKMKELDVKKFNSWNTNHMVWNLSEYNSMRFINNEDKKVDDVLTYYRTLSLNGCDISSFNPSWKG